MPLLSGLLRLGGFMFSVLAYSYLELVDLSAVGGAEGGLERLWAVTGALPPPSVMK